MQQIACWCGNIELDDFSPDYKLCPVCGTLVCSPSSESLVSAEDIRKNDFYGRDYWFEYQPGQYDYPDIIARSRYDLSERVIYWLRSALKFCLPPGKALEIGSAHGGFVALLRQVGFDAAGLEVSPWVVQFAEEHFQVPMYSGPIEEQEIEPGSLDLILMMDVLEHFPEPLKTMEHCFQLLKPDGKLFIQTPEFDGSFEYPELKKADHIFLKQLKPLEHVYLFSRGSIKAFLTRLGAEHIIFLPPCFPYDMFLVVSRERISENSVGEIERALLSTPEGRIILALLDINGKYGELQFVLAESEADRAARLENVHSLQKLLDESEADRKSRLEQIQQLDMLLRESEKDRSARLDVINELDSKLVQIVKDRSKLEELLKESEADRHARLDSINELERLLEESEADRKARLDSINELERLLAESEADRHARLNSINELERLLAESEADRTERLGVIHQLEARLVESEADRVSGLERITHLEHVVRQQTDESKNQEELIRNQGNQIQQQTNEIHSQAYFIALYEYELNRFPVNILRRLQNKVHRQKEKIINQSFSKEKKRRSKKLKKITVDLTPILPGGENGGAKMLATALVCQFSRNVAPQCEYCLLTSDDSHDELSWLDASNVQRICVNHRLQADDSRGNNQDGEEENGSMEKSFIHGNVENSHSNVSKTEQSSRTFILQGYRDIIHLIAVALEKVLPRSLYQKIYMIYKSDLKTPRTSTIVSKLNADLLFCPFTAPYYYSPGIPTVVVVHDLQYQKYPQYFTSDESYNTDIQFKKSCQLASRLICVSDFTQESVIESGNISPDRVKTIHTSFYNPLEHVSVDESERILDKYQLERANYLLYPANFWQHKNHELLLTAFSIFVDQNSSTQLKLVLTGAPGDRMNFLKNASERMGLGDRVIFTGFVNETTLSVFFQNCLAMIFPSLHEGFGVPVLEAMSFDAPVLCSNMTSLPEVGGDAVHYFDPRKPQEIIDAIDCIFNDRTYRENLVKKGKRRLRDFIQPEQWAEQYFNEFKMILRERQITVNQIYGLFSDHWAGEEFEVTIKEGDHIRFLEFNLGVPGWIHDKQISGKVYRNNGYWKRIILDRGQRNIIRFPISHQAYRLKLNFKKVYQPKEFSISSDDRFLSCRVIWCRLLTPEAAISIYESGLQ